MKTKIAILSFAHMHAESYARAVQLHPRAELVTICDYDTPRAEQHAQHYGVAANQLALGADAAIIASENSLHRRYLELAVDAGVKAILCEKPLAATSDDARAMIAHCAKHGVQLYTAFPCRFSPAFLRLREQVHAGVIGEVLAIRGTNRGFMPGGWFTVAELAGGGAVIDHTVHVADLNRWLLGKEAVEVYAEIANGFYHQSWDDTGLLAVTYEGGVFATIDTSWSRPNSYPRGDLTLQVLGTGGVIDLDMFSQNTAVYGRERMHHASWGSDPDALMIDEFIGAVEGKTPGVLATGEDGLRALEIALGAYRSAQLHQPVALEHAVLVSA